MSYFRDFKQERAYYRYKANPYDRKLLTPEVKEVLEADKARRDLRRQQIEERKRRKFEERKERENMKRIRALEARISKVRGRKSSWSVR